MRTRSRREPEGEGRASDTPDSSVGNGDQWKSDRSPCGSGMCTLEVNLRREFPRRFLWLMRTVTSSAALPAKEKEGWGG